MACAPWSVRKDTKSSSYLIDFAYLDEGGVRRRYRRSAGRGVTKREAEQKARALYRELQRDPLTFVETFALRRRTVVSAPFAEVAQRYLDEEVRLRCRPSTQRTHEQLVRVHLVPFFGQRDLRAITRADVSRFVAETRDRVSPKTTNNALSVISSLCRFAVTLDLLDTNPTEGIKPLRVDNEGCQWLDRTQGERFLAAVRELDPGHYPVFLAALRTGMRQGELLALRWRDIRFDVDRIDVRHSIHRGVLGPTKGNEPRWIPLAQDLRDALQPLRGAPETFVFTRPDGQPLTGNVVKNPMRRAKNAVGRPELRFHDLRHSFASQLVEVGVQIQVVQKLLGHRDIKTTLRYAHLRRGMLEDAVARLGPQLDEHEPLALAAK